MGESSDRTRSSRRSKRRRSHAWQSAARFWSEWHVEIVVAVLVILAVFLLVEHVEIRRSLALGLRQGAHSLEALVGRLLGGVSSFVRHTTLSDLTAYVLLFLALIVAVLRLRWRLLTQPRFRTRACPRCGSDLHRIHRHRLDRLINLYVPVRRYRCKNDDCLWQGLRVGREHHP